MAQEDLPPFFRDQSFLEDLKRLGAYVEANGIPIEESHPSPVDHLMDVIKGLAVLCAYRLKSIYGTEQDGLAIQSFKPRVVISDAVDWHKKTCQVLGVSEQSGWIVFQDWFFISVLTSLLKIALKKEHWDLIDFDEVAKWVSAEFRHFIAYEKVNPESVDDIYDRS